MDGCMGTALLIHSGITSPVATPAFRCPGFCALSERRSWRLFGLSVFVLLCVLPLLQQGIGRTVEQMPAQRAERTAAGRSAQPVCDR